MALSDLVNTGKLTLNTAKAVSGLASTGDQFDRLSQYDPDFADWLKMGLGKFSQANTLLKTGQGIMSAYEAYTAGKAFGDVASSLTSGTGVSGLGAVGGTVGKAIPWIGLGLSAYNLAKGNHDSGSVAGALGSAGSIMASNPVPAALGAVFVGGMAVGKQHLVGKASRNYFQPYLTEDLGDGKYLLVGNDRSKSHEQTYGQEWSGQAGDLDSKDKAFIYDKNTNSFSSMPMSDLVWQFTDADLVMGQDEEVISEEKFKANFEAGQSVMGGGEVPEKYSPQMYVDYVAGQKAPVAGNRADLKATASANSAENMASMGGDDDKWQGNTPRNWKDGVAALDKEALLENARYAIAEGYTTPLQYSTFKDTTVIAEDGKVRKYPITLESLQSAVQGADAYHGWGLAAGATSQGEDMATYNREDLKAQGFTDEQINWMGQQENTTVVDAPADTGPVVDTSENPYTEEAVQVGTTAISSSAIEDTRSLMEEMFGLQPGDLQDISAKLKASQANVRKATGGSIDSHGVKLIPKGEIAAATNEYNTLLSTYNPYKLAGNLASSQSNRSQAHDYTTANMKLADQQKRDYAQWALDNGLTPDHTLSGFQKAQQYAASIGGTVDAFGKIYDAAGKLIQGVSWLQSIGNPDIGDPVGPSLGSIPDYRPIDYDPIDIPDVDTSTGNEEWWGF